MKSLPTIHKSGQLELLLWQAMLVDAGLYCSVDVERDLRYASRRFQQEGLSFFLHTLPELGSWLDRALGEDAMALPPGFKGKKGYTYPTFLSGFFQQCLEPDGTPRDRASKSPNLERGAAAVSCLRQLTRAFKKVEMEADPLDELRAVKAYAETDASLGKLWNPPDYLLVTFQEVARALWSEVFAQTNTKVASGELLPRHGSGATADRLTGNRKWTISEWPGCLDTVFPIDLYLCPEMGMNIADDLSVVDRDPCVRVTTVPKTFRKPRVIAVEETAMQYAQQAIMRSMYDDVLRHRINHVIGFRDQERNRRKAESASVSGDLATLDLSEASDRVHLRYAALAFSGCPHLWMALEASRSQYAELPDGSRIRLNKFASMGSATCFPVEAVVFATICISTVLLDKYEEFGGKRSELTTPGHLRSFFGDLEHAIATACVDSGLSVYGDDIIVPTYLAETVTEHLEAFGLKVNTQKSFSKGFFRESCGGDYWCGRNVTPVYIRQTPPLESKDSKRLVSYVDTSNLLYKAGWWTAAELLQSVVEGFIGPLPVSNEPLAGLHWETYLDGFHHNGAKLHWDEHLHRYDVSTFVARARRIDDELTGYPAMLKTFLSGRTEVLPGLYEPGDAERLVKTDRPYSAKLHRKRVPVLGKGK